MERCRRTFNASRRVVLTTVAGLRAGGEGGDDHGSGEGAGGKGEQSAEAAGVGKRVEVRLAGCEGGGAGGEKASVKVLEATVRQGWWWRGWAGDRACRDVGGDGGGQGERTCRASARATVLGGENNGDGCALEMRAAAATEVAPEATTVEVAVAAT